ncbi:ciliary microtubule associated protein 1B isoform X3 [Peromyscus maniculatus bairdii]|uniref:ciliary microtubule associated protein 1B isoform X3 n=1 Tax=Peromyscus maniculatus bairdii TaxID=230844 RepID=UPI003FD43475
MGPESFMKGLSSCSAMLSQEGNHHRRLQTARPISAASPRLHLRLAPALAAHNLRARAEPSGARPHDRARHRRRPGILHLWSPTPHSALPHSGTGQVLPRTLGKRDVPQRSPAYHRSPKLGHSHEATNPRPWVLHCAVALGPTCHRQSLSPNLLHLRPQQCGQLLRGPQQDPRPVCLPRCEPRGLQEPSPAVHHAAADFSTPRKHSEARTRKLQRGRAPEASWLELRNQALRLSGPHDTPRERLMPAGAHRPSVVCLKLFKPALSRKHLQLATR